MSWVLIVPVLIVQIIFVILFDGSKNVNLTQPDSALSSDS